MKASFKRWVSILSLAAMPAVATVAPGSEDAKTLFDHGLLRRAAAACEQRLAADAQDAQASALLSRIRSVQGKKDEALKLATAAVTADAKSADVQYALAEAYGREAQQASMIRQAGLAGKMRKASEAALAIDPNHVDALAISSDFYRMAPGIIGGDKKKAAEYVERIAKVDAVAGWLRRANLALSDKDSVRAAECYRQAAAAQPPDGRAQVAYASWLSQPWRDPQLAEKLALAAVQAEPWRTGGWQLLAAVYAHQERWADLENVLRQSEAAEPSHLAPWYQAARQLIVDGKDPARAEAYLRHYLSRDPEIGAQSVAAARWRLGLALEQQGRKADAVTEVEAAVKLDPKLEDAKKDLKRLRG